METTLILCRWVQFFAAMLLFGGSLFRLLLNRASASIDIELRRWMQVMCLLASASAIAWLMLEAGAMGEGWPDTISRPTIYAMIDDTSFGHMWATRLLLLPLIIAIVFLPQSRPTWVLQTMISAALLGSLALSGHAIMDDGLASILHPLNHAIHLLAGGAWIGALLPLWLSLNQADHGGENEISLANDATQRFARIGYIAVALVTLSGLVNSWFLLGNIAHLATTLYGNVLSLKLILVGAMLGFAALNRFYLAPKLKHEPTAASNLRRSVVAEAICAACILAAASILGTLPPSA